MCIDLGGETLVGLGWMERLLSGIVSVSLHVQRHEAFNWAIYISVRSLMVSLCILVVGVASGTIGTGFSSPRSAAVVTAPAPLAPETRAGANGSEILFLPLFSYVVGLPVVITRCFMGITLEFSLSIPETCAAHLLAIFSLTIPLLSDLVVDTVVMAPFR